VPHAVTEKYAKDKFVINQKDNFSWGVQRDAIMGNQIATQGPTPP
jgi:hypothetical protein